MTGEIQRSHRIIRTALTLLHTSDLHIGSDVYPERALQGFDAILDIARQHLVDTLLIAGDLFDRRDVPEEVVSYVFNALARLEHPVVVLPGNHDTLLIAPSFASRGLATNVHVLLNHAGELITFNALGLSVWGCPVYDHAPSFHPLAGLKPRPHGGWYVAIGHGMVTDGKIFGERASPITLEELAQADCDYIALGHTHVFREVTQGVAPAFYSGAPSDGQTPTAALVTLHPLNGVAVQPISIPS